MKIGWEVEGGREGLYVNFGLPPSLRLPVMAAQNQRGIQAGRRPEQDPRVRD